MEGATATDMTVIAQQAALDYERKLAGEESVSDEEEWFTQTYIENQ